MIEKQANMDERAEQPPRAADHASIERLDNTINMGAESRKGGKIRKGDLVEQQRQSRRKACRQIMTPLI